MSIPHFSALSSKRRNEVISNPERFSIQEKIDGTNFTIGAHDGNIWVGRKNGKEKYFAVSDWPVMFWTTQFRHAHTAANNMKDELLASYGNDFITHCELLTDSWPNTITYFQNENNLPLHCQGAIVVYDVEVSSKMGAIKSATDSVLRDVPHTNDGATTEFYESQTTSWLITPLDNIDATQAIEVLREAANIADVDEQNEMLLERLIRSQVSQFGAPTIEGLVFKHIEQGWSFKLVDRIAFTQLNTSNYETRRKMFRTPGRKTNSISDVYDRNILSGMNEREAKAIAFQSTSTLLQQYMADPTSKSLHSHTRNLESFASLHKQFQESK